MSHTKKIAAKAGVVEPRIQSVTEALAAPPSGITGGNDLIAFVLHRPPVHPLASTGLAISYL
jgi:hypothetical protein